jgi:hypothetical protein
VTANPGGSGYEIVTALHSNLSIAEYSKKDKVVFKAS